MTFCPFLQDNPMTLLDVLSRHLDGLPLPLREVTTAFLTEFDSKLTSEERCLFQDEQFASSLVKVCSCSPFVCENGLRYPNLITDLYQTGALRSATHRENYASALTIQDIDAEASLARWLRQFRRREMLRIDRKSVV